MNPPRNRDALLDGLLWVEHDFEFEEVAQTFDGVEVDSGLPVQVEHPLLSDDADDAEGAAEDHPEPVGILGGSPEIFGSLRPRDIGTLVED
jgi:hypothetical protein